MTQLLFYQTRNHLHLLLHPDHLVMGRLRTTLELYPLLFNLLYGRLHGLTSYFQLSILLLQITILLLQKSSCSLQLIFSHPISTLHFSSSELFCFQHHLIQQLILRLHHVFVVFYQILYITHTVYLLIVISVVH